MQSLWRKQTGAIRSETEKADFKNVKGNSYDVIVIGAGMAGILTAYYLQELGKRVLVLEANTIASGQTEKTTAKITSQHGLKYSELLEKVGIKKARIYARANEAAINEYERLIDSEKIECQFERVPAYLYSVKEEDILKEEARVANLMGIDAFFTKETELPFAVTGAVCFRNQAQFAPLEFMKHLCADLEIVEHVRVLKVKGNRVITKDTVWFAGKIIVTTHYPIINMPGFYFLRQHQERSYVLALSGCQKIKGMYLGIDEEGYSFRQAGDYLLLGGGAVRTGKKVTKGTDEKLKKVAKRYFPNHCVEAYWAAQDCIPHDGIPFIGRYSLFTPNLYVATGFQKWGMTSSMVAALLLRDEISGIRNPYSKVFSPQRLNIKAAVGEFFVDVGESARGLIKGTFSKKAPRCKHLGCELVWNPEENSWDCPCHGSRYDKRGKILDNPTKKDIDFNF